MAVAQQKKKKKGDGQTQVKAKELFSSMLPNEPAKNFTLIKKDKGDKGSKGMVETYAKAMEEHMLRHYEMFTFSMTGGGQSNLNPMDLLYYHTYGDYRMVLSDDGKIQFVYRCLNSGSVGQRTSLKVGENYVSPLSRPSVEGVNGVYSKTDDDRIVNQVREIAWMTEELNKGSSGIRLMLPSIGTLMVMTYGYTNISVELSKLVYNITDKLDRIMSSRDSDFDMVAYLSEAVLGDSDLPASQREAIEKALEGANERSDSLEYFIKELIESTSTRFIVGDTVRVKEKELNADLRNEFQAHVVSYRSEDFDYQLEDFVVIKVMKNGNNISYEVKLADADDTDAITVRQSALVPSGEPQRYVEKQKKSYVAIPGPEVLVFYRILIDQIFALHSYLLMVEKSSQLNFGYLSKALTPNNSQVIAKTFPEMFAPEGTKPDAKSYIKKKMAPFINQIVAFRSLYTQMIMKAQRAAAMDKTIFDEFYKGNLLEKEIRWLSFALSEEAKVLVKKPEVTDPLTQLTYKPTAADERVQLTGDADRRTVFYQVDIPMFKEVVLEYVSAFNEITLTAAFSLESGDAKEGVIAKAVWGSIRKRSGKVFMADEVMPFKFFNELFASVNSAIGGTMLTFDPYPPTWSDTNTLALLTVDPNQLGTVLTKEDYQKYLNEYIDYIYLRFGNRARIASTILTALESYRFKNATDYQALRAEFAEMLADHDKKSQMKGTTFNFRAYNLVISIMRAELAIPLQLRSEAIAQGMEEEMSRMLAQREYGDRGIAAVPRGHSLFTELDERAARREESRRAPAPVEISIPLPEEEAP